MSNSSAKYCQHVKDRLYKKLMKDMKVFLKKKKKSIISLWKIQQSLRG